MSFRIVETSHYLPDNILTNQDLIDKFGLRMKSGWVEKIVGIKERRWAVEDQATSDLATFACEKLNLKNFQGPIFLSTITGDYLTPSTSSILKRKLNLNDDYPCFDINAACAGYLFALDSALGWLERGKCKQALVIATECRSRFINTSDRRTAFLFGDAACAMIVEKSDSPNQIEWVETKTEASKDYEILIPAGGTKEPFSKETYSSNKHLITMNDGTKISEITKSKLIDKVLQTLESKNQSLDDFDHFIFHQGNGLLIRAIAKEMGISESKVWINFDKYGNSSSASVGLSLSEAIKSGSIKNGERILIMAMGAGYHIGIASILWGQE
ncbi:MAG: ketoacyl-ACP synthase III [Bacteriovoracaceae bacterium]|nr:ketoacyl-ACP synthase III [Bacteriovoracaceae bacterium]